MVVSLAGHLVAAPAVDPHLVAIAAPLPKLKKQTKHIKMDVK